MKKIIWALFLILTMSIAMASLTVYAAGWQKNENEDGSHTWSYINSKGARIAAPEDGTTTWHTIDGKKYAFDADGNMLWGWVKTDSTMADEYGWSEQDTLYYCGDEDDGARAENEWKLVSVKDQDSTGIYNTGGAAGEIQEYWFYFGQNGRKVYADELPVLEKSIKGSKYAFDSTGKMLSGWVNVGDGSTGEDGLVPSYDFRYYSTPEKGHRTTKGWFKAVPSNELDSGESTEGKEHERWFYTDDSGTLVTSQIKTIGKKKYAFNRYGEMLYGLCHLVFDEYGYIDDASSTFDIQVLDGFVSIYNLPMESPNGLYYFGGEDDGAMRTGKQTVNVDDADHDFFFKNSGLDKGCGMNGEYKDAFYVNGCKLKAEAGETYQAYAVGKLDEAGTQEYIMMEISPSDYEQYGPEGIVTMLGADHIIYVDEKGKYVKEEKYKKLWK